MRGRDIYSEIKISQIFDALRNYTSASGNNPQYVAMKQYSITGNYNKEYAESAKEKMYEVIEQATASSPKRVKEIDKKGECFVWLEKQGLTTDERRNNNNNENAS